MSDIKNVALLGATGSVGKALLPALLDAKFNVTVLTRLNSTHVFDDNVKAQPVDLENLESLTKALQGQDAVISTVAAASTTGQKLLVDAAVAAGVKRILPSEYGSDLSNSKSAALAVSGGKVAIQRYIEEKTKGTGTSYTFVFTSAFLDFGVERDFLLDVKNRNITLYDGGDVPFTVTPLDMVANGVVAILKSPEKTANRGVRIHGALVTQNQVLNQVQQYTGQDTWSSSVVNTADADNLTGSELQTSMKNVILSLFRTVVGPGYGGDMSKNNDNALLGLKELSPAEVEEIVKRSFERNAAAKKQA